jgi:hypothetical protein
VCLKSTYLAHKSSDLSNIRLTRDHFFIAMKEVRPSALREVFFLCYFAKIFYNGLREIIQTFFKSIPISFVRQKKTFDRFFLSLILKCVVVKAKI